MAALDITMAEVEEVLAVLEETLEVMQRNPELRELLDKEILVELDTVRHPTLQTLHLVLEVAEPRLQLVAPR